MAVKATSTDSSANTRGHPRPAVGAVAEPPAHGRYRFQGEDYQLPLSEPAKHNAIHGLVRWTNLRASLVAEDAVTMTQVLHPQPGYPFAVHIAIEYALTDE